MLKYLNISNFAVIQQVEIGFRPRLNLLTGETGSGKSILVDSLSLLMGARSSSVQVRTGERVATVEGLFEPVGQRREAILGILAEVGVELEPDRGIIIRREIHSNGRSRIFIEDQSVTVATLRALQPFLVEIHGQGEQRSLLSVQSQMDLLDSYGGCLAQREKVAEAYALWRATRTELEELRREMLERERAVDLIQYQLSEIQQIAPRPAEDEELLRDRKLLTHAEKLLELGAGAYAALYESDQSVIDRLSTIRRQLEELSAIDARVSPLLETLLAALAQLSDVADALRNYGDGIEFSPSSLSEIEQRLAELEKLKRKYNTDLEGILRIQDELSERLCRLDSLSAREESLRAALSRAEKDYRKAAALLTERRLLAASELAERVMADLRFVAMEQARFYVEIETAKPLSDETAAAPGGSLEESLSGSFFTPNGADRVEFYLSANPGEEPRPLARVASGGELSRLMLTLRTVSMSVETKASAGGTVIFDEIDVGIGGRVAEAVGRRLKSLGETRQVLCVTHQPQIARFADHHFVVQKAVERGRTQTTVRELLEEERVPELARMIGGGEGTAQTTLDAARWLLESAREESKRPRALNKAQKILSRK